MASRLYIEKDSGRVYEFGPFCLDEGERSLSRDGQPVALTPKVFDTLLVLVHSAGHLIDKDDLMKSIWPDSFVEEANLNRSISTLRRALGEAPNEPRYIETVPTRGYRFIAPLTSATAAVTEKPVTADANEVELEPRTLVSQRPERRVFSFTRRAVVFASLIALGVIGIVYLAVTKSGALTGETVIEQQAVGSLAVLPFKVIGTAGRDEFLGMGITDVLITRLSNAHEITVRPTSAVLKYQDQDVEPIAVGSALRTDAVLEGSVQRVDDRIRVTVRLMSVNKAAPLWAGKFDEPAVDILRVQDSIAERVTKALSIELRSSSYTKNVKAHEFYVKGRSFLNQRDMAGIAKAQQYFHQAIEEDPDFALAYSGLADLHTMGGAGNYWGEQYLQKALELDETLGEAHASKGFLRMFSDWRWNEAEESFKRAIELKPGYPTAYQWYANLLAITGRLDEAKEMMQRGLEIDPFSHNLLADFGQLYYFSRDYDKALEISQKALKIEPDFAFAYHNLNHIYYKLGRYADSLDMEQKAWLLESGNVDQAYAESQYGNRLIQKMGGWESYVKSRVTSSVHDRLKSPFAVARNYLMLGDRKRALDWLDQSYDRSECMLAFVGADPRFDDLRSEPRYQDLLRRMGLTRWLFQ